MVSLKLAQNNEDLIQILKLQKKNLKSALTNNDIISQGFVTVEHDLKLLQAMNAKFKHVIAVDGNELIGYALVMTRDFRNKITILKSMFKKIDECTFKNKFLKDANYFVMGQICIAKNYRGQGVFKKLYNHLKMKMKNHFTYVITEVADENQRSLKAHYKVGFKTLLKYKDAEQINWVILIWEWH